MTDYADKVFEKMGFNGSSIKAMKFVIGSALIAFSLSRYTTDQQLMPFFGFLVGAYLIIDAMQ